MSDELRSKKSGELTWGQLAEPEEWDLDIRERRATIDTEKFSDSTRDLGSLYTSNRIDSESTTPLTLFETPGLL